jgi:hypothetical protein
MGKGREEFAYLRQIFPPQKISEAKIKRMNFRPSTKYTNIRGPRLWYETKLYRKESHERILKRPQKLSRQ